MSAFVVGVLLLAAQAVDNAVSFLVPATAESIVPAVARILWLTLYLWSGVRLWTLYGSRWLVELVQARLAMVVVLAVAVASILWSLDSWLTTQRTIHLLGTTLIAVYLGYHYEIDRLAASLFAALCLLVVGGAVAAVALPELGRTMYAGEEVWRGLQTEKNGFGITAAACVLLCLVRAISAQGGGTRMLCAAMIPIALVALFFSNSATSVAALAIAATIGGILVLSTRLRAPALAGIALAAGLFALSLALGKLSGLTGPADWVGILGRSGDFTGRTDIWAPTWSLIMDNPLFGYGYGALWFPRSGLETVQHGILGLTWTAFSAHNGFLQLASEIGLPAAILAFVFALATLAESVVLYRRRPSPFVAFAIAFQVAFLVANVVEAGLFTDRNPMWILFVAVPLACLRSYRADPAVLPMAPEPRRPAPGADGVVGSPRHG